ncbi:MAG: hypothetical protein QOI98_1140 [Solirubrobacteraceae bacterium]|jgi:hypothetical protein|nr:hypothetical protein [Solirubrobacteraceae bacterium]
MADHDWDEIASYYNAGHTMRECKKRFGFSNHAWDKAVVAGLVVPRVGARPKVRHDTREAVERLLAEGLNQTQVAFELGLSKPTVNYHARRLGIAPDERWARRYDWAAIQEAHDSGLSRTECMREFGFAPGSWDRAIATGQLVARPVGIPIEELLVAGRPRNRDHIRRRILKAGLKEERCEVCGLNEWRGAPLRVALHHINGDGNDNRLENLSFLCPNCHAQTPNYGGRNGHRRPAGGATERS